MPKQKKSTVTETSDQFDETAQLAETEQPASGEESAETKQTTAEDAQPTEAEPSDEVEQPAIIEKSTEAEQTIADAPPEETEHPAATEESVVSTEATKAPLEQSDSIGVPDEATIKSFEANVENAESEQSTTSDFTEEVSLSELDQPVTNEQPVIMKQPITDQSDEAAFLAAIEQSKYIIVSEVADVDEEEYTETPYSRLPKLEKYKVAYALWDECTPKSPAIRRILAYLSFLIFYSQLFKKKRKDKELKASLKEVEAKLADEYEGMFSGMFK